MLDHLEDQIVILTVSCQRAPENQNIVKEKTEELIRTNRDPHLLFSQLGVEIGFVSEDIVRGAFLSLWIRNNNEYCNDLSQKIKTLLEK